MNANHVVCSRCGAPVSYRMTTSGGYGYAHEDGRERCPVVAPTLAELVRDAAARLTYADAREDVADSFRVTLRVECDPDSSVLGEDASWLGELEEIDYRRSWSNHPARPARFDGGARILRTNNGANFWWQPPAELVRDAAAVAEFARTLTRLLEDGYYAVGVVLERRCDAGCWHEHAAAWVGGVDSIDAPYLHELRDELAAELASQL